MRLIDADELEYAGMFTVKKGHKPPYERMWRCLVDAVKNAPTVNPVEQKHGKWIVEDEDYNAYKCSVCGEVWCIIDGTPQENGCNYCQHCGSKMDEVTEDANC